MPRYRLKQGNSSALISAADYAGAVKRGAEIGFKDPDSVVLMEDAEEARARAIRAYANMSDRAEREAERRALGGEN